MKRKYKYAVIILNYNVALDAVKAAKSVNRAAQTDDYIICIADNGSTCHTDILPNLSMPHVRVMQWEENGGYARGNNRAIRELQKECDFEYVVIMNPDVIIERGAVIDEMTSVMDAEPLQTAGISPLIHHLSRPGNDARYQYVVKRCHSYWDEFLFQSSVLKHLLPSRIAYLYYAEHIPYQEPFYFEVPSGCFFMIRAAVLDKIGLFDERTFLYQEEQILGFKIKEQGMRFKFLPSMLVEHYHGKATGNRTKGMSRLGHKALTDSVGIYLSAYVGAPRFAVWTLTTIMRTEYAIKALIFHYDKK